MLFFLGMLLNMHSDYILRNLRRPGESGYKIPRGEVLISALFQLPSAPSGGLFEYVSGANYTAEIVEWLGYALLAQSLPAWAFFISTVGNIGPRALQHHK